MISFSGNVAEFPALRTSGLGACILAVCLLFALTNNTTAQPHLPGLAEVEEVVRRANDYWIAHQGLGSAEWDASAYYIGNQRAFRLTGEDLYLKWALNWARDRRWRIEPGVEPGHPSYADYLLCGQVYLDLYRLDQQPDRIADIRSRMSSLLADAADDSWWWIDAFYMAGPTLAKLGNITGDNAYLDKLLRMYRHMRDQHGLYDATAGLWYRDGGYLNSNVFWARGNGWVVAGLARVLDELPDNAPQRVELAHMFTNMCARLKTLQGDDGMWRSSVLAPDAYSNPETSGTSLITFAMAWGVRNGLLNPGQYTATVANAWHGLTHLALKPSGLVGYVQRKATRPGPADPNETHNFGVGAFLLACSEIGLLAADGPNISPWAGPDETVLESEPASLDGSATDIHSGTVESITWWAEDVLIASGFNTSAPLPPGRHVVTLRLSHSSGKLYTSQVIKTVKPVIATAGPDQVVVDRNGDGVETVTLDAGGSRGASFFEWWSGGAPLASGRNAEVSLPLGRHVITLKTLNSEGKEDTDDTVRFVTPNVTATASSHVNVPGYVFAPANALDDDLLTHWSAQGSGQWIRLDLGGTHRVSALHCAFLVGDIKPYTFAVESSLDGSNWTMILSNASSVLSNDRQRFAFPTPQAARHIRLTGYGNATTSWNSYTETTVEIGPTETEEPDPEAPLCYVTELAARGTVRNDYNGWVGFKFTTGNQPLTVSQLGRYCVSGNRQAHPVKLVRASNGEDVPGGATEVVMAGSPPDQFNYARLTQAVTLPPNTMYYLVSREFAGGDRWLDLNTVVETLPVAQCNNAVYGPPWINVGTVNNTYVPVNMCIGPQLPSVSITATDPTGSEPGADTATFTFRRTGSTAQSLTVNFAVEGTATEGADYDNIDRSVTLPAGADSATLDVRPRDDSEVEPPETVTVILLPDPSYVLDAQATATLTLVDNETPESIAFVTKVLVNGRVRNDYSGWVGFKFTTGNQPLTVYELGRYCVSGNQGKHEVKLVRASDGEDVTGGSVETDMAACPPDQFAYARLEQPLTLLPNTMYYLVSREFAGGDRWLDLNTVVETLPVARCNNAVYGPAWINVGTVGNSYGPLNMRFWTETPLAVTITAPSDTPAFATTKDTLNLGGTASADVIQVSWTNAAGLGGSAVGTTEWRVTNINLQPGPNVITVTARDAAGNHAADTITVTYNSTLTANFIRSITGGSLSSDAGWVGMKVTVGPLPLQVTHLGRLMAPGNRRNHLLQIFDDQFRSIASSTVSMAGETVGQFRYATLTTPVTLQPNTVYHVVSEESWYADQWYKSASVITTTDASCDQSGAIWYGWLPAAGANTVSGPVDFRYITMAQPATGHGGSFHATADDIDPPARLTLAAQSGRLQITITGRAGRHWLLESSDDLTTWNPIDTIYLPDGRGTIEITRGPTEPHQFYRAKVARTPVPED